jgi:hypothetical protein
MSLNDYARLSNKDLELYKQLSDSSYRSINGKRQNSRNFKEGVLNLGQINFEQPKDVLTKEMILDYQKEQQNKPAYEDTTSGDKFKYLPSNFNDPLNIFNPTTLPSGAAATEGDVVQKRSDLNIILSNVDTLTKNENVTKQLIQDIGELLTKLQQEEQEISNKLNDYNKMYVTLGLHRIFYETIQNIFKEDDLENLALDFISFSENKINKKLVWEFIMSLVIKRKDFIINEVN